LFSGFHPGIPLEPISLRTYKCNTKMYSVWLVWGCEISIRGSPEVRHTTPQVHNHPQEQEPATLTVISQTEHSIVASRTGTRGRALRPGSNDDLCTSTSLNPITTRPRRPNRTCSAWARTCRHTRHRAVLKPRTTNGAPPWERTDGEKRRPFSQRLSIAKTISAPESNAVLIPNTVSRVPRNPAASPESHIRRSRRGGCLPTPALDR